VAGIRETVVAHPTLTLEVGEGHPPR
jgi:hypothetical protein